MVVPKTPPRRTLAFAEDVANALGLSKTTARRWMSSGRLGPQAWFGRHKAVRLKDLEKFIEQQFADNTDVLTE